FCLRLLLFSHSSQRRSLQPPRKEQNVKARVYSKHPECCGNDRPVSRGDDIFGEMYDNVFLRGHIQNNKMQFVPGYLAIFL
ncbi:F-box only protein 8, partial [Caligus rogercresseyi]